MLGLAMRAGKVTVGTEQVCIALSKGRARLVILAADASEGTKKKIGFKCEYYNVPVLESHIDTAELGRLLGKSYAPAVVTVTDDGLARTLSDIAASEQDP